MRYLIAGGTGFLGKHLVEYWQQQGHEIAILGRSKEKIAKQYPNLTGYTWHDFHQKGVAIIKNFDVIVNLAGANIASGFWTRNRKHIILNSRLQATALIVNALKELKEAPRLLNASAIGVYGLQQTTTHGLPPHYDEDTVIDFTNCPDFLAEVGRKWELATRPAKEKNISVTNLRFAIMLGKDGGVLPRMVLPYYFFCGAKIGSGKQPFSWIHIIDVLRAIDFVIAHPELTGPINLVAPQCVTQAVLAEAIAKAVHRPRWFTLPAVILQSLLGQMAKELLLNGQHVYPTRLLASGFNFEYPDIDKALSSFYCKVI